MRIRKRYVMLACLGHGGARRRRDRATANHSTNVPRSRAARSPRGTLPANTFKARACALFVHTGTVYSHPTQAALGGKAKTVTLLFDDDGTLNLDGIPMCTASFSGRDDDLARPGRGAAPAPTRRG